tara:strand:+ start:218 stop:535 length:318 start_codon:yes stop_codon:yes gene_type:complete
MLNSITNTARKIFNIATEEKAKLIKDKGEIEAKIQELKIQEAGYIRELSKLQRTYDELKNNSKEEIADNDAILIGTNSAGDAVTIPYLGAGKNMHIMGTGGQAPE